MSRHVTFMTIDDAEHYSEEQREEIVAAYPPHEREARAKGVPVLGAGKIYPVSEDDILVEPFEIPRYWPRAFGFDADWNNTAAVWGAWDRDSDTVYVYSEHYQGQQPPESHARAIKARGEWINGAMDPSTNGKINPKDGSKLSDEYRSLGLRLIEADNAVEAGIHALYQRMTSGGLKVFKCCPMWLSEFRLYHRDEKGKVVKERDHLMDATRYLVMTGMAHATTEPVNTDDEDDWTANYTRNPTTGY